MNAEDDFALLDEILKLLRPLTTERRARLVRVLAQMVDVPRPFLEQEPLIDQVMRPQRSAKIPYSQDLSVSPKQFLLEKQPKSDVERIACLAFYLTHYRDMPHFKTLDLNKLNTEAAQPRLSNANYATANAVNYGYLAVASKGLRQLSAAGEQYVNALPDRQAAKIIMTNAMKRRRPKRRTPNGTTKTKAR
jgi:hypothetical protein